MKLRECFLCAKKTKIMTLFNDFHSRQYHNACVCISLLVNTPHTCVFFAHKKYSSSFIILRCGAYFLQLLQPLAGTGGFYVSYIKPYFTCHFFYRLPLAMKGDLWTYGVWSCCSWSLRGINHLLRRAADDRLNDDVWCCKDEEVQEWRKVHVGSGL